MACSHCTDVYETERESERDGEGKWGGRVWQTKTHVNWLFNPHNSWRAKAMDGEREIYFVFFGNFSLTHDWMRIFLFLFGHTNQDLSRRLWHQFDLTMISYFARIHTEQDKRDIWHINCSSMLPNIMLNH